ncbi:methylated-DNA--[protein]-cysteine S-methyltransferase [Pseudactinotalea sp. Z1732]|uniref:methylated-DNA--[protein]-cysteine S-methyltransferase n=1 Tax=Pseudactinotalea sp. Z1732 TaxID=3413026 RepID=UPI003C799D8D
MTTHHINSGARPAGPDSPPERTGVRALDEAIRGTVEPATLARLLDDLAERADHDGSLDVGYDVVDTPIGGLLLAATPRGLVRVAFETEGYDAVLTNLAERISPRILRAPGRLAPVRAQVAEYFEGRRRQFSVEVDLSLTKGFRREVLDELRAVEFGERVTYTTLAARSGRARAVRATASACATNPLPVVVPCHRVVRSDGSLGGYRGGLPAKERLLALESVAA